MTTVYAVMEHDYEGSAIYAILSTKGAAESFVKRWDQREFDRENERRAQNRKFNRKGWPQTALTDFEAFRKHGRLSVDEYTVYATSAAAWEEEVGT